ncbi:MAG TPA: hypothetical protein VFS79_10830, partial [Arthrobacter sp.]|nr:hypothetical protein [Arthrobacter sp.]
PASPPGSPATGPTGAGSSSRAGSEAGPTLASDLAGFQFSLQHSSLKDVIRSSDELPGSVSLEHGFSPD